MDDELVRIGRFDTASEAHMARVTLEEEGIEAVVEGEDSALTVPVGSDPMRIVDLLVRESDMERALAILREVPAARDNLVDE